MEHLLAKEGVAGSIPVSRFLLLFYCQENAGVSSAFFVYSIIFACLQKKSRGGFYGFCLKIKFLDKEVRGGYSSFTKMVYLYR